MSTPPQQPQQQYSQPQPPKKKRGIGKILALGCGGLLVLLVVIIIIVVAASGGSDNGDSSSAPADDPGATEQQEGSPEGEEEAPAEGGEETAEGVPEDSDYDITIDSVERTTTIGPEGLQEEAQGEYIVIEVSFTNNGSEAVDLDSDAFKLQSTDGTSYEGSTDSTYMENSLIYETVNPGNTYTGAIAYDVPEGTEVDSLVYQDIFDLFGEPVAIPIE